VIRSTGDTSLSHWESTVLFPTGKVKTRPDRAEGLGYLWEQDGPATATASEGGKPIKNSVAALRLRLRLRVEDQVLTLSQETNGVVYTGGSNPGIQVRLALQARKVRKATSQALAESGLAPT
jgi:hypothetical protein